MPKLARGVRAMWLTFDNESYTLIGREMDELNVENNPEITTGRDVTGASYATHNGFAPQTSISYMCRSEDAIYSKIKEINDNLIKDEAECTATMIVATLDKEVKESATKALTGSGYKVNVLVVPTQSGGDTGAFTIPIDCYETGARTQGTVAVAVGGTPTFTAATGTTGTT